MAAFQQALANLAAPSTGQNMSIRGSAGGAPSNRSISTALRSAGITRNGGMEVDGGAGRPARNGARGSARAPGPLDQSNRPSKTRSNAPYSRPPTDRDAQADNGSGPSRRNSDRPAPGSNLAARIGTGRGGKPNDPRRAPEGTPPILQAQTNVELQQARQGQQARLNAIFKSEEFKQWLRRRLIGPGIMDMSKLPQDEWLKKKEVFAPGHRNAAPNAGPMFWKLIDVDIQKPTNTPVHTLSLANNDLTSFRQLDRLAHNLQHIRALDLSNNPVKAISELDVLLAKGEKKGNATGGAGSLKSLIELKLNGCEFREAMLKEPDGAGKYQHEILRRFPGLLILDGVNLNRIIFPIERKPKVHLDDTSRAEYARRPFTFPANVQGGFIDNELVNKFVMAFCAKFFPLFDTNRPDVYSAYAPTATISAGCNTLMSRSHQFKGVDATRSSRPPTAKFEAWVELPARNLFRITTIEKRLSTLKSPGDVDDLGRWWSKIPETKHPLDDPQKWCIDAWVVDGEGTNTKLCAMIQGQFQETNTGSYRSFSRTFILADASEGTRAQQAGWPCQVLSDTLVVHNYLSSGAYDDSRSIAVNGVSIQAPGPTSAPASASAPITAAPTAPAAPVTQDEMVLQLRQRTGMNQNYASMCMAQNGWDFQVALRNFDEIKATIPAEAYQ